MLNVKNSNSVSRFVKRILVWSLSFMLVLILILVLQYSRIEIFYKEKNKPFSGDFFYNPYKNFTPETVKANFHTHSSCWLKITSGAQSPDRIYSYYKKNGYDIISISNYHRISIDHAAPDYIPVYEHGYNYKKFHQLVINCRKVTFLDFPFFNNYHTKQTVIKVLGATGGLIALAHPDMRHACTAADMKYLKGYDFIEVLNIKNISTKLWDAALTAGYPAWIIADDDCHDIDNPDLLFNNWNRISAKGKNREDILNALKAGCAYGVRNPDHLETNFLESCKVKQNEISVCFSNKAGRITFVADGGAIRKEVHNAACSTYKIAPKDSYVRIEARKGDAFILLNPVIRYNGFQINRTGNPLHVNTALTFLTRGGLILLSISILMLIFVLNKKNIRRRD